MNDIDIDNNETGIRIKDVINMLNEEDGDGMLLFWYWKFWRSK